MIDPGSALGDYEVVEELERGGMAMVYVARQPRLGRRAALKQVDLRGGEDLAERFVREARLAGSLNHPNVVTVFDFFEHDGIPYIAMEYLERGSLRPWMDELTLAQSLGVLEGMLAGLAHAHDHGIVHRDIKPENVLVTAAGAIKLADFGIAKAYAKLTHRLTKTGMTVGTPCYMAPEQALNLPIGPWTDLYATGIVAYEMLLRRLPFEGTDTPIAVLLQHVNDPVPPPRSLDPTLDPHIAAWIESMLAKDPEARPQGAHAAWEQLEEAAVRVVGPLWRRGATLLSSNGNGYVTFEAPPPPRPPVHEPAIDSTFPPVVAERAPEPEPPRIAATQPPSRPPDAVRHPARASEPTLSRLAAAVAGSARPLVGAMVLTVALASFAAGFATTRLPPEVFGWTVLFPLLAAMRATVVAVPVALVVIVSRRSAWRRSTAVLATAVVCAVVLVGGMWWRVRVSSEAVFVAREAALWAIVAAASLLSTRSRAAIAQAVAGAALVGALMGVWLFVGPHPSGTIMGVLWWHALPAVLVAALLSVILARLPARAAATPR